jgi:signal transduction histidine kinase
VEVIDRESRRLAHLVENLLQFSRSGRAGPAGPPPPPHELGALVREVVESFSPVAEAAGVRFRAEIAPSVCARVDPDAFRQVLLNLLDNAVKYGPKGQEISVALDVREGRVRLAVEDEGPGIPAAERERVFCRFERLARDKARTVTGTGLGLAVVRELLSAVGGRAFVEEGRGGGACLVVELRADGPREP